LCRPAQRRNGQQANVLPRTAYGGRIINKEIVMAIGAGPFGIRHITGTSGRDNQVATGTVNIFDGSAGADTMHGGDGASDIVNYASSSTAVTINLMSALQVSGGDAAGDTLYGIEDVTGSSFSDLIKGNMDVNHLEGGGSNDTLSGGFDGKMDWLYGGEGSDTVDYSAGTRAMTITLGEGATAGLGQINSGLYFNTTTQAWSGSLVAVSEDALIGIENVIGSQAADAITGSSAANKLDGGAGNDRLIGLGGADTLMGGDGQDTVDYSASDTGVRINLTAASQTGGHAEGDQLIGIENITGSAYRDFISGDASNNVIYGGGGDDILYGGGGFDTLRGGDGNDRILAGSDAMADLVEGGAGADWVIGGNGSGGSGYTFTLGTGNTAGTVTTLAATGGASVVVANLQSIENVVGSTRADQIFGNGDDNMLGGNIGNDTIFGGNGNDTIRGGVGDDNLTGGVGTDLFVYGSSNMYWTDAYNDLESLTFSHDTITDFTTGQDLIDISQFDVTAATAGTPFHLVSALTPGEARALVISAYQNGMQNVQGDANGDGVADFSIDVFTSAALVQNDFIL
jgi:Ca2+-binding RTX toxin-like protein